MPERTAQVLELELGGERVLLHPERALICAAHRALVVADLHFGKDDAFRRSGLAWPAGAAAADLERLAALLREYALERLVVLGDFFHAAPDPADDFFAAFRAFRAAHPRLAIEVVAGNHDRHGGLGWLAEAVTWHADGLALGAFELRHEPGRGLLGYVLAGHLHPVAVLAAGGDRARLPVFWVRADHAVLPSFGSLTGGHPVRPARGDRLYACTRSRVLAVPVR
ncbi:MAG: ligase-associated DNA damage response endonuclease PdeM [Steroidobacteraceae bacterium]|jgi:DNA ligase-associated metallophosphoesterase|nr:ligase-associated DNA damage response endonuclease PdeM [Steroidobacteraceae bacterium]